MENLSSWSLIISGYSGICSVCIRYFTSYGYLTSLVCLPKSKLTHFKSIFYFYTPGRR